MEEHITCFKIIILWQPWGQIHIPTRICISINRGHFKTIKFQVLQICIYEVFLTDEEKASKLISGCVFFIGIKMGMLKIKKHFCLMLCHMQL